MKSTSICRSCQASMYSGFEVRTIVCASESFLTSVPATRLISSRDVQAIMSAARSIPASWSTRRVAPLPAHRADVVAVGERLQPRGVEVDDGDVVVVVERLDDGRADLPGPEEDDLHGDRSLDGRQAAASAT